MSVKLNPAYRSVDKVGYGKGKTTGSVPANNIPSLGIVGVASGSVPAEVSASTKAVKALGRQADEVCDPDDPDYDPSDCDGNDRKRRK